MLRYFIVYKPYQVLSAFTAEDGKSCLADFFNVPKDVYPLGRLDYDSEGLLILTNDKQLNQRLLHPKNKHEREYWVQVEGQITQQGLKELQNGVKISVDGKEYQTLPCRAYKFESDPVLEERNPPIRFRKNVPVSWIRLSLHEGKNRQVRKMTAKAGFPTLLLVRYRIEKLTLDGLQPGDLKELTREEVYQKLFY